MKYFNWVVGALLITLVAACGTSNSTEGTSTSTDGPVEPSDHAADVLAQAQKDFRVSLPFAPAGLGGPASSVARKPPSLLQPGSASGFARVADHLLPRFAKPGENQSPVKTPGTKSPGAETTLPVTADKSFNVRDSQTGLSISVALRGAHRAEGEVAKGYVVYSSAYENDAAVLQRPHLFGTEEYISFPNAPSAEAVTYDVSLGDGVEGVRLVANSIEFLDRFGTPRLRMAPPFVIGSGDSKAWATVSVDGCAVDHNALPPWGRSIVRPGSSRCAVHVSWAGSDIQYPAVLDPSWSLASTMSVARAFHGSARVKISGKDRALVYGGATFVASTTSAELYDELTGTWAQTGSMVAGVELAASTLQTDGRVLVFGGYSMSPAGALYDGVQSYNPTNGSWSLDGSLGQGRMGHTATPLPSGRILVAGGLASAGFPLTLHQSAALYDPSSHQVSAAGNAVARAYHTANLLSNGKVLVAGGIGADNVAQASAELYDPTANSWSSTASMPIGGRYLHTATALQNGQVLVAGGSGPPGTIAETLSTALFSPNSGAWSVGPSTSTSHFMATSVLLTQGQTAGKVLLAGGDFALATVETFDPVASSWKTIAPLGQGRDSHQLLSLASGLLFTGGTDGDGSVLAGAELYNPEAATAAGSNSLVAPPLDRSVVTTTAMQTQFLYTGANPVQTGVLANTIDPTRAAGLVGTVKRRDDGAPLGGVTITVVGHPEYGQTQTQSDGTYRLAINGTGARNTLNIALNGYLPARRDVRVAPLQFATVADVALVTASTDPSSPISMSTGGQPAAGTRMYRGPTVTDANGSRQLSVYFPPLVTAGTLRADQTTQTLPTVTLHATEYTVGPNGAAAMPADLPPTSAYTYAFELAIEEGTNAQFSAPIPVYVDNFLSFPVGTPIPSGFYDRPSSQWIPSPNGRTIKILSVSGGLANLDISGSGTADAAALTALGITDGERAQLASSYPVGKTLWRVPVSHFSLFDFNLGYVPPAGAKPGAPGDRIADSRNPGRVCKYPGGSTIECETQTLTEAVPLVGTPYELHYRSDREAGRGNAFTLKIPVTPATIPGPLVEVDVTLTIAGRSFTQVFTPTPNQVFTFTWDGFDAFGRRLQGPQPAVVQVDNVYNSVYAASSSFGAPGTGSSTGVATRRPAALSGSRTYELGVWDVQGAGMGGWDIDVHHTYDPVTRTVQLGNGRRDGSQLGLDNVISTVAGNGTFADFAGLAPDGTKATLASIQPLSVVAGPDGLLYIGQGECIQRVTAAGTIEAVLGQCTAGGTITPPVPIAETGFAFGPQGDLYFTHRHQVRKLDAKSRSVTVVAGTGEFGFSGDGGPALAAKLWAPSAITVGVDGAVYVADDGNRRVRKIGTDGTISTIAGNGELAPFSNDVPATESSVTAQDLAVAANGDLYLVDIKLRRIGPDGFIREVPSTDSFLDVQGLALGLDGSVFVYDSHHQVRRTAPDGTSSVIAGTRVAGFAGDSGPASAALLNFGDHYYPPRSLAVGPDGSLYIADTANFRVRRVQSALPGVGLQDIAIASEDGEEIYVFNSAGQHLLTLDAYVAAAPPLYDFAYDPATRLLKTITDVNGNVTTVLRDGSGNVTGVRSPFGQDTVVALGSDGYVASISNPAAESTAFTYYPGGLIKTKTSPRGFVSSYTYDAMGRLTRDSDPPEAGGFQSLSRTETANGWTVDRSSRVGRTTRYAISQLSSSSDRSRDNTFPDGNKALTTERTDGTRTTTLPNGMVLTFSEAADPRFGMGSPVTSTTTTTPGGLTRTETVSRGAVLSDPTNLVSLTSASETRVLNGRTYQNVFDPVTRKFTSTSPASRKTFLTLDNRGRIASTQLDTLLAREFGYDTRGRLATLTQGARTTQFGYDAASGFLVSTVNALNETTQILPDAVGRPKRVTYPDAKFMVLGYDADGNLSLVTPPEQPAHLQTYSPVNLLKSYEPPAEPDTGTTKTTFGFDFDRNLGDVTRPGGVLIGHGYDTAGRLQTTTLPTGTITRAYHPTSGNLSSITGPAGETLSFGYDGMLVKSVALGGPVTGTVSFTYDNDFRVVTRTINSGAAISFGYDPDSLLTSAGSLSLVPDAQTGLLKSTSLGAVSDSLAYDAFGALASYGASFNATSLFSENVTLRDALGRIKTKTETIQGTTRAYEYNYDTRGRLTDVKVDSTLTAHYAYDGNGNRTAKTSGATTTTGVYDTQDRLKTYGSASYTYTANGELKTKTVATQVTTYTYDAAGNLLQVALPGGPTIDYIPDGLGRRVGKKLNGTLVKGFLYEDQLRIAAELDATNNVVSTFIYGTKVNVPEYMTKAGVNYRLITDHLGSVRLVVKVSDGSVAQRIDYDEFGVVTADTNPGFQPFGFAGGLYDSDTKLVRFGARDYDASVGRWTSKDPIRLEGGEPNFYAYVRNDPVNTYDLTGLSWVNIIECVWNGYSVSECFDRERKLLCRNQGWFCRDDQPSPSSGPIFPQRPKFPDACREPDDDDDDDSCTSHYSRCQRSPLLRRRNSGSAFGEAQCASCRSFCQALGKWPAATLDGKSCVY